MRTKSQRGRVSIHEISGLADFLSLRTESTQAWSNLVPNPHQWRPKKPRQSRPVGGQTRVVAKKWTWTQTRCNWYGSC